MVNFSKYNKELYATDFDMESVLRRGSGGGLFNSADKPFDKKALIGLNEGQVQMVLGIIEYFTTNKAGLKYFVVYGAGGTGKTTAIIRALQHLSPGDIIAAAPSHFAKNVLQKSLGDAIKVFTIASMLGKKIVYVEGQAKLVPNKMYESRPTPISMYDIVIIDEVSMVDDVMGNDIVEACDGKKLVVMGE